MFCKARNIRGCLVCVMLVFCLWGTPAQALQVQSVRINLPEQAHIKYPRFIKVEKLHGGDHRIYLGKSLVFPLELVVADLFGAHVSYYVTDPSELQGLKVESGFIRNPQPNPVEIYTLPKICPRARVASNSQGKEVLLYNTRLDIINERPTMQLFDPDISTLPQQRQILSQIDGQNVLKIERVSLSYDFEDDTILDYAGPNPLTGRPQIIYEGQGGFYANLHYAVVPYDKKILGLGRQELLSLAQGKLAFIDHEELTPKLRTHSFIPGPYQSTDKIYPLCEWGDTAFQARRQEMFYSDLKVWDWDLKDQDAMGFDRLLLVVWEGDEEDWLISEGLLDPYYLTDDVIGVFDIRREQTLKPLRLVNPANNFEMVVRTEL